MDLPRLLEANFTARGTPWRRLVLPDGAEAPGPAVPEHCADRTVLKVHPAALRQLAFEAFRDINFLFRTRHLEQWAALLEDPAASANDRYVAAALLKNAAISAEGIFPSCQDTGTATIVGLKGENVRTGADDAAQLTEGVRRAYTECSLRFSQVAPVSMLEDADTRTNLPAQVSLHAAPAGGPGAAEYRLLFVAKGGGSANKTFFFQETRALLTERALEAFLREKIASIGTAGCPPYHLGVVIGGTSAEANLEMLKLATAGALDSLPDLAAAGNAPAAPGISGGPGTVYRDSSWEARVTAIARDSGIGAQFGGVGLALDARVVRMARHAASLPVSIGVSCSAHRNALARIGADGAWLEDMDRNPSRFLDTALAVLARTEAAAVRISLDRPVREVCADLSRLPLGALALLSGPMIVARDAAHARLARLLEEGKPLPSWFRERTVYYAGPSNTPPGQVIGSFGPTTAQRMDPYVRSFMAAGHSRVMLAKGNRSKAVAEACREFGGFSLGTIGGAAALIGRDHVVSERVVDFADLGFEAARAIEVRDLPAFVVIDDKGASLYG
jgi:fumarate hydratase class I